MANEKKGAKKNVTKAEAVQLATAYCMVTYCASAKTSPVSAEGTAHRASSWLVDVKLSSGGGVRYLVSKKGDVTFVKHLPGAVGSSAPAASAVLKGQGSQQQTTRAQTKMSLMHKRAVKGAMKDAVLSTFRTAVAAKVQAGVRGGEVPTLSKFQASAVSSDIPAGEAPTVSTPLPSDLEPPPMDLAPPDSLVDMPPEEIPPSVLPAEWTPPAEKSSSGTYMILAAAAAAGAYLLFFRK